VRNTCARRVEIDAVLARERFDLCVFRQIFRRRILDVVIDREYRLPLRTTALEGSPSA